MADNVNIIVQDTINDIVVNAAVIVETIDINVQAAVDDVQIIANPNNYIVNINRIIGEQVQSDWTQTDNQAPDYIKNKPTLAAVATSGDYNDLSNTPTLPTATSDLTNDGSDGVHPFITAADVTAQVNSDWNATTGVAEILNKPTIPAAQVNSDWNAVSGLPQILNKPTLAAVATSGSYTDLSNKPTIPAAQVNSDWNATTGVAQILNKPTIPAGGLPAGGTTGQILTKVDATDYNATWQENYADWTSVVKHTVKNNGLSGTITKGTAVYVTGSNGTNMLVGRASNASEATSSKTMGLMQSDITTTGGNQTGFVITEGLLEGLNTAGQTAGDPVWLGVNGALIYGLANKPYAPAHLVFIGIVTKVSAGNGEIFVKVQNGFELKEIHDVDLITTTPINGHLLGFDGTLWVNKTIASWLGYTPVTDARTISTTAPLSGGGDLTANRTLSITQATTSTNGYLSSTDWNTFNGKGSGTVTSVSALTLGTTGTDLSSSVATGTTTPVITLNVPTASATNRGALSSTDWSTFNGKFTLPALTSGSVLFSNGTTIAQKNANFFWDDTNNRLGIGTNAPAVGLDIRGGFNLYTALGVHALTSSSVSSTDSTIRFTRPAGENGWTRFKLGGGLEIASDNSSGECRFTAPSGGFFPTIYSNGIERMRIFGATGNIAINTTTDAGYKLDVNGTARVTPSGTSGAVYIATHGVYVNRGRLSVGGTGDGASTQGGLTISAITATGKTYINGWDDGGSNQYDIVIGNVGSRTQFGIDSTSVSSAQVSINSTTKGFLPPRMTTTQKNAIATPAAGLVVYDTTLGKLCVRTASAWETITSI